MCRAVPPCPRLLGHTWPHHSRLTPGPCQPAQPRLRVSLSPQCLCLQADGRGLLHPVRVLAGRDLVEKVGQCPCAGLGAGGLKGLPTAPPPCPACPTALPCVPWGICSSPGVNTPIKDLGSRVWCWGVQKLPCPHVWAGGSRHHIPLTLHPVLQPLAVQLQQDFPAVHPQLAGVPGAADHHALPR